MKLQYDSAIPLLGIYSKELQSIRQRGHMYTHTHTHTHIYIYIQSLKERNSVICSNMDGTGGYNSK
jgi:hypothetical protein